MSLISDAEREYIEDGAEQGVRADGRGALDVRPMTLETGVLPNASGSARVRIGKVTDILVGIKCEITEPMTSHNHHHQQQRHQQGKENEGILQFSVECSSLASPDFNSTDLNAELTRYLYRLYSTKITRRLRESLCIIPGKKCWLLHVDALVLDSGGNVFGALSIAVRAALRVVVLPHVMVVAGEGDDDDDVQVNEQVFHLLPHSIDCPVAITLSALRNVKTIGEKKDGVFFIADCTSEEEMCAGFALTVGVNWKNEVCGIVSAGKHGIDIDSMNRMIKEAVNIGVDMLGITDRFLQDDIDNRLNDDGQDDIVGFFA